MKKTFQILFVFYFLALSLVPCADREDCNEFKQTETSQAAHQQEHSDEVCTPFCACSCCAAHFLVKDLQVSLHQIAVINTIYTPFTEAKTSAAVIPIWQPPKLG